MLLFRKEDPAGCTLPINIICLQMKNIKVENINERPQDQNIFTGTNAAKLLGEDNLSILQRPVLVQWSHGKVR